MWLSAASSFFFFPLSSVCPQAGKIKEEAAQKGPTKRQNIEREKMGKKNTHLSKAERRGKVSREIGKDNDDF
jgi:hypothetical protein